MKKITLIILFFTFLLGSSNAAKSVINTEIERLESELCLRKKYDALKRVRIDSLTAILDTTSSPYHVSKLLYEEYKSYNHDTALIYVRKMLTEATRQNNQSMEIEAKIANAFVFLSGGLFKEAYDILEVLSKRKTDLPDNYYLTFARLLYDMADYAEGDIAEKYNEHGNQLLSVLCNNLSPADSSMYWYGFATIDLREGNIKRSIYRFEQAMLDSRATEHHKAIWSSSIGFLYRQMGDIEQALIHYIDAAIYDIQASVYETVALRMVAEILYEQGEIELADKYIHIAMKDAKHYHARYRQVSNSQLLPIIEKQYIKTINRQNLRAYILLIIASIFLVVSLVGIFLLGRRTHTLNSAQQTIDDINQNLLLANRVKEQMLSTLMVGQSQYLSAVERYQTDIKEQVSKRNINGLSNIPKNVDAHIQRQLLNRRLDEMLLGIFPNFVDKFNLLLKEDAKVQLRNDELLTPALRIFALIRLGISQNEVIAEVLDYSINTVYTYKTRTINSSIYNSEKFYEVLMNIPSFAQKN